MPELPEVETIRRELAPLLVEKKIRSVLVVRKDIVGFPGPRKFAEDVTGRKILELARRGKYLIFKLDKGKELIFHLRLSGQLQVRKNGNEPRFERVCFGLSDRKVLSFIEPRALGRVYLVAAGHYPGVLLGMEQMGFEPISPEFTVDYLAGKLRERKAKVKSLLLNQRVCCGVGNIYSDEALFRAGVRPTRPGGSLTGSEVKKLVRSLSRVINDGIRWCGTSLDDGRYVRPGSRKGVFQQHLRVFGREGLQCKTIGCREIIRRTRIGNRSSYFCPVCQK